MFGILRCVLTKHQLRELKRSPVTGPNRLGKAMQLARVTQVALSERTGFTQSYVSKVLNGQYSAMPGETMRTFARAFGCSIEDLFPAAEALAS